MRFEDCTPEVQAYLLQDRQWFREQRLAYAKTMKRNEPGRANFWDQVIAVNTIVEKKR
jgi:hypothetical protein